MNVDLVVHDPNEERAISFGAYQFTHQGCSRMVERFDQATDVYVLRCTCGLEIRFPRFGRATNEIVDVVIDGQPRALTSDLFDSN